MLETPEVKTRNESRETFRTVGLRSKASKMKELQKDGAVNRKSLDLEKNH